MERGRRWVLPLEMKLSPLRETEQVGGDKSMALFPQRRPRNYVDVVVVVIHGLHLNIEK